MTSIKNILSVIKKSKVKWIRLQFCNPFGLLHQISIPSKALTADSFTNGFPLDGSSILGFTSIEKSDIVLIPDPSSFAILPDYFDIDHSEQISYVSKAARMFAFIHNGFGGGQFPYDSRFILKKAHSVAKKFGYDKTYWAAELEFFIFDKIITDKKKQEFKYYFKRGSLAIK